MGEPRPTQHAPQSDHAKPHQAPRPKTPEPRPLPPWKVLLHNDDVNYAEDVVRHVYRLTPLNERAAVERVLEAHYSGVSLLVLTHKERAELYVEQFASCGLTVSIEPQE